ncbi:hypothetical protein PsYK624_052090 [Phanerochaete sordida]|uniref:Uncharacterized protein n=1 Tax=Phanerochaete sordida TaxID=48140 RepID=A0A9P3G7Y2_9APHY|nr:hypothetical protein PsYK624_052090 [Phanerochaete sordida]
MHGTLTLRTHASGGPSQILAALKKPELASACTIVPAAFLERAFSGPAACDAVSQALRRHLASSSSAQPNATSIRKDVCCRNAKVHLDADGLRDVFQRRGRPRGWSARGSCVMHCCRLYNVTDALGSCHSPWPSQPSWPWIRRI